MKRTPTAEPERLSAPALLSLQCRRTELAKYAAGMSRRAYLAACYVWARDYEVRERLELALAAALLAFMRHEVRGAPREPKTAPCPMCERDMPAKTYAKWLAEHVAQEIQTPWLYGSREARAKMLEVRRGAWDRLHGPRYGAAWAVLMNWLDEAHRVVRGRMRLPDEESIT